MGRRIDGEPVGAQGVHDALPRFGCAEATALREQRCAHHPDTHREPVVQLIVLQHLIGVGKGVAQVQHGAPAPLVGILFHHIDLDLQGRPDEILERGAHAGMLKPGEQRGVADHARLDDLRQAGAHLGLGQGLQYIGVHKHEEGLDKGAHQVLALGQVHGHLAAYAGVDHPQQCGGHLHQGNPPHKGGSGKPGHVGDHAAAESDHGTAAVQSRFEKPIVERAHRAESFMLLAGGQDNWRCPVFRPRQSLHQRRAPVGPNVLIAHHDEIGGDRLCTQQVAQQTQPARHQMDGIGAGRRVHQHPAGFGPVER